jgi:hypothetical protein
VSDFANWDEFSDPSLLHLIHLTGFHIRQVEPIFFRGTSSMFLSTSGRLLATGFLAIVLCGCGKSTTTIEGTVTYLGKPLVYGSVTLLSSAGLTYQGQIQPDGKFVVEAVPAGTFKVAVSSVGPPEQPSGKGDGPNDKLPAKPAHPKGKKWKKDAFSRIGWFSIPEKYSKFDESGLSVTVGQEVVHFDIQLTD